MIIIMIIIIIIIKRIMLIEAMLCAGWYLFGQKMLNNKVCPI